MRAIPSNVAAQIGEAYREMAERAKYRPAAPSDGLGNITIPKEKLNIEEESASYTPDWWKAEDDGAFHVGVPSYEGRKALIFLIEAARNVCSVRYDMAIRLLEMATLELRRGEAEREKAGLPAEWPKD